MIDSYLEVATRLKRGVVTRSTIDGRLVVREEDGDREFVCDALRLIAGPRIEYPAGTEVLIIADDDDTTGYVLGALGPSSVEPEVLSRVAVTRDGDPSVIYLRARQRLKLTCGRASLMMTADGTIVLDGPTVVTHATGD